MVTWVTLSITVDSITSLGSFAFHRDTRHDKPWKMERGYALGLILRMTRVSPCVCAAIGMDMAEFGVLGELGLAHQLW
jgi:hypothetical protein